MKSKRLYLAILITLLIPINFVSYATEVNDEGEKSELEHEMLKFDFFKSRANLKPPRFTDEEYAERLQQISGEINFTFNKYVRSYIHAYTITHRAKTEEIIGRTTTFFPHFEETLAKYNVPTELKYLSIIESALRPKALSKAGARGLWQFMPSTGKLYNLDINATVDQRCDTYLATDAAARYLRDMNRGFKDWMLTIAAYNCGPGRVRKAIKRAGSRNIWKIYPYLPRETRGYVPAFISVAYLMNYYYLHQLYPVYPEYDLQNITSTRVYDRISFADVSAISGLPIETVRYLNPSFNSDYIPDSPTGYHLFLPRKNMAYFKGEATWPKPRKKVSVPDQIANKDVQPESEIPFGDKVFISEDLKPEDKGLEVYEFQKGDNLWEVAEKFPGVTVKDIIKLNRITDYRVLRPGLKLLVQTKPELLKKEEEKGK